jgi:hypothetical protein
MWIFVELMKDYSTEIPFYLTFKNVPEDLILVNQNDSVMTIGVNAQGFELLVAKYLKKRQTLELDLSDLRIRAGSDGYSAVIPASRLKEQVSQQISFSRFITSIRPDTLLFRFSEIYRKQVRVIPDIRYTLAGQYLLSDSIRVTPAFITVSSIKDVIDTIRSITTVKHVLEDLDSNRIVSLPLRKSLNANMIRYSADSVTLHLSVQKYTEAVINIPVTITGNSVPIRIYPDQVEVTCLVPFSEYKDLSAELFSASVNASPFNLANTKRLEVNLTRFPAYVRSVHFKPDQVEYLIISK